MADNGFSAEFARKLQTEDAKNISDMQYEFVVRALLWMQDAITWTQDPEQTLDLVRECVDDTLDALPKSHHGRALKAYGEDDAVTIDGADAPALVACNTMEAPIRK